MPENLEKTLNGFFTSRFSREERLRKKSQIFRAMCDDRNVADSVAEIVIKFLGSARHCLQEFEDIELVDLLFFLSSSRGVNFSSRINRGVETVMNWPEWEKLPNSYQGVKIYTS
ncbi:MAG TPA: hypothetical protein ENJ27_00490 [Candidatus Moranbacteria bacterium]|nr:hypothetical protein [Candidatus Moranbacteria bacterium]